MKHLFLPYELAVIAKDKGFKFDWDTFESSPYAAYVENYPEEGLRGTNLHDKPAHGYIYTPLYQQIIDWFREKHNVTIEPYSMVKSFRTISRETVYRVQKFGVKNGYRDFNYTTLNKAITEAFKLI